MRLTPAGQLQLQDERLTEVGTTDPAYFESETSLEIESPMEENA